MAYYINITNMKLDVMKSTIVETPEFISRSKSVLSSEEIKDLIDYLSDYPEAGDLIAGTGGVRKLRWQRRGMGKRGGSRVIYFYYNDFIPLFLLTVYAKNQRSDLAESQKSELREILQELVKQYMKGDQND
jgi:hypothetical protein